MAHTPGPWNAVETGPAKHYLIYGNGDTHIASTRTSDKSMDADAALIAAAPELLEALKAIKTVLAVGRNVGEDKEQAYQDAEEFADCAIAKAEATK